MLPLLAAAALAGPVEESQSAYARAHADIAQVLGFVSMHCPVAERPAGSLVGEFSQRIHNGWYSHVTRSLEGHNVIEAVTGVSPEGRPTYRSELVVRWSASEPGEAVRCTIEPVRRTPIVLVVATPSGQPVEGTTVYGCGDRGVTDAQGRLGLNVYAFATCQLRAYDEGVWYRADLDPAHHDGRVVALAPYQRPPSDYDPAAEAEVSASILEVYEGLAPLATTPEAAQLYAHLIRHREGLIALQRCHASGASDCSEHHQIPRKRSPEGTRGAAAAR